ncbi:hypothetical protein ACIQPP_49190 [Streptomyces violaceusniger]|nr:hypothetical protein [Streptomyces hygroscopicus]
MNESLSDLDDPQDRESGDDSEPEFPLGPILILIAATLIVLAAWWK